MRVSAKADYAVGAMVELAGASEEKPVQPELVQVAQEIPPKFVATILTELGPTTWSARAGAATAATG